MSAAGAAREAFESSRAVLDALARAVVVTDVEGRIAGWNEAARHLYGWTGSEPAGRPARDLFSVAPGSDDDGPLATAVSGERWSGDLRVQRADGTVVWVLTTVSPLRDRQGRIVGTVGAGEDVTEQRRAERRAAAVAEHLELALEAGRMGTWRWDRAAGTVVWDPTMERLYGLAPGTFPGTFDAWLAMRDPDAGRAGALDALERAMASREPYEIETRAVWPDGSVHWLLGRGKVTVENGEVTGAIGCTIDITDRKAGEIAAAEHARSTAAAARRQREQLARLSFLTRISDAALTATDHRGLMHAVTRDAVPHLGDWCVLVFVPEPGASVDISVAHPDPERRAWVEHVLGGRAWPAEGAWGLDAALRTGATELVPTMDEDHLAALAPTTTDPVEVRALVEALALTSVVTVPLTSKRGVLGALQLATAGAERAYDEDDRTLVEAAAGRVAEALDDLWLNAQQRRIATALQRALLPPDLPAVPGVDVASRYWPTGAVTDVGGDFYDLFPIGGDRWAVVIGDVCGTGPDAAAVTGITRHTIRAAATHGVEPAGVLAWLNDAVNASGRDRFCTALYGVLGPATGDGLRRLTVTSGGHPLPVVARADGKVETIGSPGTLIGVFPTITTPARTVELRPGDTVVLYTDGVTDLPPPHGLTAADVEDLVGCGAAQAATADGVAGAIGEALAAGRPSARQADDIALLVLRVREPSRPAGAGR